MIIVREEFDRLVDCGVIGRALVVAVDAIARAAADAACSRVGGSRDGTGEEMRVLIRHSDDLGLASPLAPKVSSLDEVSSAELGRVEHLGASFSHARSEMDVVDGEGGGDGVVVE